MASDMDDPFRTPDRNNNGFDPSMILSLPSSSPNQLKRTLEAHLQEVVKRIENAGALGQKLLAQQQEIVANIKELEEGGDTVDPELKKKLVDLEKEYNEVGREAARAALTNKIMTSGTSPYGTGNLSGGTGGSPSTIQAQGTNSPTKLSVPSRRQRNQPSRQHDLEFAAELGQGLLVEVRRLQALLSEREETLKIVEIDKAQLEQHAEGLEARIKALDESEQKFKEENWNLELQNQELLGQIREHEEDNDKLQALIMHEADDKDLLLKDLDELKNQNEKLYEDLEAEHKHHESEFAAMRRSLANNETDRHALEQKLEELKTELEESHNQSVRLRHALEHKSENQDNSNLFDMQPAQTTPEHSPPPSPTKPTPRHTHLESETLRSSLQHAHRMIANLKSNIHREKTEKSELRRLLQDARDEIETARLRRDSLGGVPSSADKRRKGKPTFMKGGRPPIFKTTLLGGQRHSRDEITIINNHPVDEEWEEAPDDEPSPTRKSFPVLTEYKLVAPEDPEDTAFESAFETANEIPDLDSTDAFETANEQDSTETEAYKTGNESPVNDYPTSADDMTETEGGNLLKVIQKKSSRASSFGRQVRPLKLVKNRHRDSVASTASTEDDEEPSYRYTGYDMDDDESSQDAFMTPIAVSNPRLKLRVNRTRSRGSRASQSSMFSSRDRAFSVESSPGGANGQRSGSPSSLSQRLHTPGERKSLFAELEDGMLDLDGGEDDEGEGETGEEEEEEEDMPATPTKAIMPPMSTKAEMIDSGVMTEEPFQMVEHPELERQRSFLGVERPGTSHSEYSGFSGFSVATIGERASTTDVGTQSEREPAPAIVATINAQTQSEAAVRETGTQFDPELEGAQESKESKGKGIFSIPIPIPIPIPTRSSAPDLSNNLRLAEESRKLAEETAQQAKAAREVAEAAAARSALDFSSAQEEIIALRPKIVTLETEIQSLRDEKLILEQKAGAKEEEVTAVLKPKIGALEREIEALTVARASLQEEAAVLQPKVIALEKEVEGLKDEKAVLAEKAVAHEELIVVKPRIVILEKEVESLTSQHVILQEKAVAQEEEVTAVLRPKILALEKEIEALAAERASLQEKAGSQEREVITVLQPRIAGLEKEVEALALVRATLQEKTEIQEKEIIVLHPKVAGLEKNVEALVIERATLLAQAEAQEKDVVTVLQPKIADLEKEVEVLALERAALQEKSKAQENDVATVLQPKIAALETNIEVLVLERAALEKKSKAQENDVATVLQPKIADLEKEVEALALELAALQEKSKVQENDVATVLQPKIAALEKDIEVLTNERATLQERASAQEKEVNTVLIPKIAVLEKGIETLSHKHATLQEKAASQETEVIDVLKPQISALEKRIEVLTIERTILQEKVEEQEKKEVTELQPKILALEKDIETLTAEKVSLQQKAGAHEKHVNTILVPKIAILEKELHALTTEHASLQEKAGAQEKKETTVLQPKIAMLETEVKSLITERTSLQEKAGTQERRELTVLQPRIAALEKEIANLKAEREVLQVLAGAHEEVDVLKPRIVVLEKEVESLKTERDVLLEKVDVFEGETIVLKPKLVLFEEEVQGLKDERAILQKQAVAHEEEVADVLKPRIAVLEKDVQVLVAERAGLQDKVEAHEEEAAIVLKPRIAALEKEVQNLGTERASLQEKAGAHEKEIAVLEPIVVALEMEVKGLKVERDGLQEKAGAHEEELHILRPRIISLEEDIESLTAERTTLQEGLEAHVAEVVMLKPRVSTLEEEIEGLSTECTSFKEKAMAHEKEILVLKPIIVALETKVQDLQAERDTLHEEAGAHEEEVAVLKPKIIKLELEMESLKGEVAVLAEKAVAHEEIILLKERDVESLVSERAALAEKVVAREEIIVLKDQEVESLAIEQTGLQGKIGAHEEEIALLKPRIVMLEREILDLKDERTVLEETLAAVPVKQEVKDTGVQFDFELEKIEEEYTIVMDKVAEVEPSPEAFLGFSKIQALATTPIEPSAPQTLPVPVPVIISTPPGMDTSISSDDETPKKVSETVEDAQQRPTTPSPEKPSRFFGSMFGRRRPDSPAQESVVPSGAGERTFSTSTFGAFERGQRKPNLERDEVVKASEPALVSHQSAQTDITSEFFDNLTTAKVIDKGKRPAFAVVAPEPMFIGDKSSTKSPSLRSRASHDSFGLSRVRGGESSILPVIRRPGSATSLNRAMHPPLPADHKEHIAAAQKIIAPVPHEVGSMGPPPVPSNSTLTQRNIVSFRPKTPNNDILKSAGPETPGSKAGTTPRPKFSNSRSEVSSPTSRRSSLSSFASEIDTRFNIAPEAVASEIQTDPRMIQAITQTMIGEYLWKYTRSAGRGTLSASRHKRFFWVHPYTRTLYWSDRDPTTAGRTELRAKSVAIEAVRVVTDDNPMPPGLHRKSLVIMTPGRSLKFTAPTGQRHETWFNALSYLLLRTGGELGDEEHGLNSEDVRDFNPGFNNGMTSSVRGAESLSSYNTRTTRASSPARNVSSLSNKRPGEKVARQGSMSRLGNLFRPSSGFGTFSTKSSRNNTSLYDQSDLNDSAEELREDIEQESGELLENVRACCDGKHDVSTLPRRGGRKSTQSARGRDHHHVQQNHERNHSHT